MARSSLHRRRCVRRDLTGDGGDGLIGTVREPRRFTTSRSIHHSHWAMCGAPGNGRQSRPGDVVVHVVRRLSWTLSDSHIHHVDNVHHHCHRLHLIVCTVENMLHSSPPSACCPPPTRQTKAKERGSGCHLYNASSGGSLHSARIDSC